MDKFVVLTLHTDSGPRHSEFQAMQQEMAGTSTIPLYLVVDPAPSGDRVLATFDYNQALDTQSFAEKLEKAYRRFRRNYERRQRSAGAEVR